MIILHATVCANRFLVWGESPLPNGVLPRRRGRAPKNPKPQPLPFAATEPELVEAFTGIGMPQRGRGPAQAQVIWLPTIGRNPLPSSPVIAEAPPPGEVEPSIAPWVVTAQPLDWGQVVTLLCACAGAGNALVAPGVVAGHSLLYWLTAARFAAALVARGQVLPSVVREGDDYAARWQPVITGQDTARLAALATAMPGAARAITVGADGPVQVPAVEVLARFVEGAADQLCRTATTQTAVDVPAAKRRKGPLAFASLHDQWLHALSASDARLRGSDSELASFALQVQEWHRPVTVLATAPFRLCFRLEEPSIDDDQAATARPVRAAPQGRVWSLHYLLQAADDPSLLVPAAKVWAKPNDPLWRKGPAGAGEYLLAALGQAARVSPLVEASLNTSAPATVALNTHEAYAFLTESAPGLEEAGFGVMLPAWWAGRGTKARLAARARAKGSSTGTPGGLSLDQIVAVDWEVALGEERMSLADLRALARMKAPLVRVRGQWVELRAEEIKAALALYQKAAGKTSLQDIVHMALGARPPEASGLDFAGVTADGWVGELLARLRGETAFEVIASPPGFVGSLRPYQERGYSWLAFLRQFGLGACLADDMGLGKTVQTLAMILRDWATATRRPVLLICPTSVVGNWQKEAARFTPQLPVLVHHGSERSRGTAFHKEALKHALVVSSYALLHRDVSLFREVEWAGVVLDEAQNIKNPGTKQAGAARALKAGYRIALTGTPVENHVGDLWSVMEFLNPGLLGNQTDFRRRFLIPIQANGDVEAAQRLKQLTGPFILRRLKTDKTVISDLPEKQEMKVACTLTREQASLYAAVVQEAIEPLEEAAGMERRGLILATLGRLKQVCNHPAQFLGDNSSIPGRSGKLTRLTEMLEEVISVGDRALIFTQFVQMGSILQGYLQDLFGRQALFLHGGVPKARRDTMVERFQAGNGPQLFIISLKAGGTGLNLTQANHVFHFDRWWNPAVEDQATDRAFRIGQKRNVQVYKFLCAGTLEEKIDQLIERKKEVAGAVVGTGESWLTELSTAELRDLFALREEAVAE